MPRARNREGPTGPRREGAGIEGRLVLSCSCAAPATGPRSRLAPATPTRPLSPRRRLRPERARPCARHQTPVPRTTRRPSPPGTSPILLPVPRRSGAGSLLPHPARLARRLSPGRCRPVVGRHRELPPRRGAGPSQRSQQPTLRRVVDRSRTATAERACQHSGRRSGRRSSAHRRAWQQPMEGDGTLGRPVSGLTGLPPGRPRATTAPTRPSRGRERGSTGWFRTRGPRSRADRCRR